MENQQGQQGARACAARVRVRCECVCERRDVRELGCGQALARRDKGHPSHDSNSLQPLPFVRQVERIQGGDEQL